MASILSSAPSGSSFSSDNRVVQVAGLQPNVAVAGQSPVVAIREVPLTLTMRIDGAEYHISLNDDKRLNREQRNELIAILKDAPGGSFNITKEMNPPRGVKPSENALKMANLINIALGHTLSFKEEKATFVVKGHFLENYVVDEKFRLKAIENEDLSKVEQRQVHIQYNCAKYLLLFTRKILNDRKDQLEAQLKPNPDEPIKSILEDRMNQLENAIEFYRTAIKENAILTAASFLPVSEHELAKRTASVKETLDSHVEHGFDAFNQGNPNYEPRDEREQYPLIPNSIIPSFIPTPLSDTSIHDAIRQSFASDIAKTTARMDVTSPEAFFIEMAQLMADPRTNQDLLSDALKRSDSYLLVALQSVPEEVSGLRPNFNLAIERLFDISQKLSGKINPNQTPSLLRLDVDVDFEDEVRTSQL